MFFPSLVIEDDREARSFSAALTLSVSRRTKPLTGEIGATSVRFELKLKLRFPSPAALRHLHSLPPTVLPGRASQLLILSSE